MMVSIVILSGVIGAAFSPWILKHIHDERASGLALGWRPMPLTAQAWQRGPVTGRYAAFGMAVNGVFTAIWLPTFILSLSKYHIKIELVVKYPTFGFQTLKDF